MPLPSHLAVAMISSAPIAAAACCCCCYLLLACCMLLLEFARDPTSAAQLLHVFRKRPLPDTAHMQDPYHHALLSGNRANA